MQSLTTYLSGNYSKAQIDFSNRGWHTSARVPSKPGWYYLETNTPLEVLARQTRWARQYNKKRSGVLDNVKNYDLQARCARFDPSLAEYWNTKFVYSGLASNLQSRAREHTFTNPGTGGLALEKYGELHEFNWYFHFITLEGFMPECPNPGVLLLLGEQVWRSRNGWPILCAE
jgi:hypothetical protein